VESGDASTLPPTPARGVPMARPRIPLPSEASNGRRRSMTGFSPDFGGFVL